MSVIQLPAPSAMNMSLTEVLAKRRSSREFDPAPLSLEEVSTMLWACAGNNAADGHRTVPSGRDCREVRAFAFTADGVFAYDSDNNTLVQISAEDRRKMTTGGQDFVHTAPLTIVFAVENARCEILTGPMGTICRHVDAGSMMQSALLAATALGLAAVPRVWLTPSEVLKAIEKTADEFEPLMAVTVGRPA